MTIDSDGYEPAIDAPRPVLRGVNHRFSTIGLDSLYLVIEYPEVDLFEHWSAVVGDLDSPYLYDGIVVGDILLKKGVHGYKLSVWDGDARLFLTDRVATVLANTTAAGQGMGALLQLGPKWLKLYGNEGNMDQFRENLYIQLELFGMADPEHWPIRVNRLDMALDVAGLDMSSFLVDEWRAGWVGYAKLAASFFSSRDGVLTGFAVGTRKGNVSMTVYDKRLESIKDGDSGFWLSVWGLEKDDAVPVTRFEWRIKCYSAKFPQFRYLNEMTFEGLVEIMNYASYRWGRFCIPSPDVDHKSRWPLTPLWQEIRTYILDWGNNHDRFRQPTYELKPDLKEAYIKAAVGWIAGLQARLGIEDARGEAASLSEVLMYLDDQGFDLTAIEKKAGEKWQKYSAAATTSMDRITHEEN